MKSLRLPGSPVPRNPRAGTGGGAAPAKEHAMKRRKEAARSTADAETPDSLPPDRARALARFMEKLKDDPYWSEDFDSYPDEEPRPDWVLSHTDEPRYIRGHRQNCIGFHRRHVLFAKVMTLAGTPAFCEIARCRRQGICDGNKRDRDGFHVGLYPRYPPCFFGFREVIREEIYLPILFHMRAIGMAPGPTYAPRLDPPDGATEEGGKPDDSAG